MTRPNPMLQAAAATPHDTASLDRHLRSVERRAFRIARLSLADDEAAFDVVQDAVWTVVHGEAPLPFWQAFDRHLLARQQCAEKPRWTAWLDRSGGPDDGVDEPRASAGARPFLQLPEAAALGRLDAALRALAPRPRQAFLLRVWAELEQARVAQAMEVSESELATCLVEALRALRADLAPTTASRDDGRWILHARSLLDASVQALDADAVARLDRIRRDALAPPVDPEPESAEPPRAAEFGRAAESQRAVEPIRTSEPHRTAEPHRATEPPRPADRQRHTEPLPLPPHATRDIPPATPPAAAARPSFANPAPSTPAAPIHRRRRTPRRPLARTVIGIGAVALTVGALVLALRPWPDDAAPPRPTAAAPPPVQLAPAEDTPLAAPDFDLLVDGDDATMLEDLAFYAWLDDSGAHED